MPEKHQHSLMSLCLRGYLQAPEVLNCPFKVRKKHPIVKSSDSLDANVLVGLMSQELVPKLHCFNLQSLCV